MPEFLFSYSSVLDYAIEQDKEILSSDHQEKEEMIKLIAEKWRELGIPLFELLQDYLGIYYKRKEFEVIFSEYIKNSIYHPVILQYGSYILEQRGKENWLKYQFNTLVVGAVHLLVHGYQSNKIQGRIDKFPFNTPFERNYVLYNSILKNIYDHFYPERIINAGKNGSLKEIWDYIEENDPKTIIQDTLDIKIDGEFRPADSLVKNIQSFLG